MFDKIVFALEIPTNYINYRKLIDIKSEAYWQEELNSANCCSTQTHPYYLNSYLNINKDKIKSNIPFTKDNLNNGNNQIIFLSQNDMEAYYLLNNNGVKIAGFSLFERVYTQTLPLMQLAA